MKKIIIVIVGIILLILGFIFIIPWLFSEQYNSNGISHFLVITIDKNQQKEYIGTLDGHKVYIESLNIKETNFRSIDAKNVSIKEAINKKIVSINDWRKYANRIEKDGNNEIFKYDNYEIIVSSDECIIRPISSLF